MPTTSLRNVSRAVAHALRHQPWLYELELDDEGWTSVDTLVEALRARWPTLDRDDLWQMIDGADKQRYELVGDRIRALYGHSVPGRIAKEEAEPPAVLLHGTAPSAVAAILLVGLVPMRRQYVHLSVDRETAAAVGSRKSPTPVILTVAAAEAARAGVRFLRGNAMVWLVESVPPEFIATPGTAGRRAPAS